MPRNLRRRRAGFSLVEVMIAMFMVAAGATMFFAMMPMASRTGKMVGNYQQAASVVQHKVDQLRGVGYGRLTYAELLAAGVIDASPAVPPYSYKTVDGVSSMYPQSTATINIADHTSVIKRVTVTLTWTGSPAKPGNGTLTTVALVAKS